jgi:hypothetical protein
LPAGTATLEKESIILAHQIRVISKERSLALLGTARALKRLADLGGPRCCKGSVYASIEVDCQMLREALGLELPTRSIVCQFVARSPECQGEHCAYHP